jgi:hypothetical protein
MSVIKEFVKDKVSLTFKERDIIIKGGWLEDDHMEKFGFLVKKSSNYIPQEPWKVQLPHNIEPVPEDKEHIQILHSADDLRNQQSDGHWVLCYYDKKRIYIYDSLNKRKVHPSHKIYLNHLFPNYPFDKNQLCSQRFNVNRMVLIAGYLPLLLLCHFYIDLNQKRCDTMTL